MRTGMSPILSYVLAIWEIAVWLFRSYCKLGGHLNKFKLFSIVKIEFQWRALIFKRSHAPVPLLPLPMDYRICVPCVAVVSRS